MQTPDATSERDIALRAMELNMLESGLPNVIATCREHQAKLGKGVLVLKMNPGEAGIPSAWKAIDDGIPDPDFFALASQADAGRGVLVVLLIYPNRVSGYVLNTNTSPEWRALTQRPFAVIDERAVEIPHPHERAPQVPLRVSDLEREEEFL
jgi:hypothetical protein